MHDPIEPTSDSDWAAYYNLRWRVLREPWQQPLGSERDESDPSAFHLMLKTSSGEIAGVGRLHFNTPRQAQVRYMAVDPRWRGRGAGGTILKMLESRALTQGADEIVLNAREEAIGFYLRHGYAVQGDAETLFGSIRHVRMRKGIAAAST